MTTFSSEVSLSLTLSEAACVYASLRLACDVLEDADLDQLDELADKVLASIEEGTPVPFDALSEEEQRRLHEINPKVAPAPLPRPRA